MINERRRPAARYANWKSVLHDRALLEQCVDDDLPRHLIRGRRLRDVHLQAAIDRLVRGRFPSHDLLFVAPRQCDGHLAMGWIHVQTDKPKNTPHQMIANSSRPRKFIQSDGRRARRIMKLP